MYIYEGSPRSPRRSPRRMEGNRDSNILKPKQTAPIRKRTSSSKGSIIPSSSVALSSLTNAKRIPSFKTSNPSAATNGQRKALRRKNDNDENKENCNVVPRAPRTNGLGVNASTVKKSQPLGAKVTIQGRLPLKEIPLNGFLDKLRKQEVATSVEIMVLSS